MPIFSIDAHQPLDVRIRRIALVRRRLDAIDRQRDEQQRRAAERIAVAAEDRAAVLLDGGGELAEAGTAAAVSAAESPFDRAAVSFVAWPVFEAARADVYPPRVSLQLVLASAHRSLIITGAPEVERPGPYHREDPVMSRTTFAFFRSRILSFAMVAGALILAGAALRSASQGGRACDPGAGR